MLRNHGEPATSGGAITNARPRTLAPVFGRSVLQRWKAHAAALVGRQIPQYRAVQEDRPNRRIQASQQALCFTQRVRKDDARPAVLLIVAPPLVQLGQNLLLGPPMKDGHAEGRFGDEGVT